MSEALLVFIGAALGGMVRFGVSEAAARWLGERFPWGTLAVNLSGALALGFVVGMAPWGAGVAAGPHGFVWQFFGLGVLGSYTTVSSFSLQTLALVHARRWRPVAANIITSVGGCLAAALAGLLAGAWVSGAAA